MADLQTPAAVLGLDLGPGPETACEISSSSVLRQAQAKDLASADSFSQAISMQWPTDSDFGLTEQLCYKPYPKPLHTKRQRYGFAHTQ